MTQETEGWLTDDELQQALGDGDIPAHFVDLLAWEVRDRRAKERERQAQRSYTQTFQRYEIAREVLAGRLVELLR